MTALWADAVKKRYQSCVMRGAYLTKDDPSISEAVNTRLTRMRPPLKRLERFLIWYLKFAKHAMHDKVRVYVGTDTQVML